MVVVPDGVRFTLQSTHQTPARFPGGGDDVTLCVAGEVANAPSSAKRATEQRSTPLCLALDRDVVLMDIRMPTVDGIKASRQIVTAGHRARVLILTTYDLDEHPYATIRAGTRGFILKTESTPRLLGAIRAAAAGDRCSLQRSPGACSNGLSMCRHQGAPRASSSTCSANESGRS